ncbi:MAG TPA: hypothetical protein VGH64_07890 [Puia sp.]
MNKYLLYIVVSLSTLPAAAQKNYEIISDRFLVFYNDEKPDSIFQMYTDEFKEKLPIEKTRAVFSGLHIQFGELRSLNLLKQDSGFNVYKAVFPHQTLSLLLAVTDDNMIDGFRLVPYSSDLYQEEKRK